ncbi:MAG: DNA-binding protein [Thermomicrobiales bacterium]
MEQPAPPIERRTLASVFELLHHERYTAREVAGLLGIDIHVVEHAAFSGELRAEIREHHILCIRREDVVAWFRSRDEPEHARR